MNFEQILNELQNSFDSDYGVSQQLLDNIDKIFKNIEKIKEIFNSGDLEFDNKCSEFVYESWYVSERIEEIEKLIEMR